jgi:hypothetical protein
MRDLEAKAFERGLRKLQEFLGDRSYWLPQPGPDQILERHMRDLIEGGGATDHREDRRVFQITATA